MRFIGWLRENYSFITEKKPLFSLLLIGLLLRLVFMPFTMMTDISHEYNLYFKDQAQGYPFMTSAEYFPLTQPFIYLTSAAYSTIIPADRWYDLSALEEIYSTNPIHDFIDRTYAIENAFLNVGPVFLKLFLLKLPYMIFDLAVLFLLPIFFASKSDKRFAFLFWLFCPAAIISSFIFGCSDIIAIFFLVLGFFLLQRNRLLAGLFFSLLSGLFKPYALLIAPFIVIYAIKHANQAKRASDLSSPGSHRHMAWKKKVIWFTALMMGAGVIMAVIAMLKQVLPHIDLKWPYNYVFELTLTGTVNIYLFVSAYVFILLAFWFFSRANFKELCSYSYLALLSFFALCFFHPQWFIVIIPFSIFFLADNMPTLKVIIAQLVSYMTLLVIWGNHTTLNLFAPIIGDISRLTDIKESLATFINTEVLFGSLRSIFTAITLFIILLVVLDIIKGHKQQAWIRIEKKENNSFGELK